ncbi:IGSF9B [Mytilus edulis]|uniref:IGSF9B n=1 Tax=Mytilus edulis TaxID=6550 RepID=A0A8S3PQM3_MYTED|nr:IGSF9B [Mytilus edulis]
MLKKSVDMLLAPPVITADNKDKSTQYGNFGKSTELKVNVYSIPKYSSIRWYRGNMHLISDKYITKEEPVIVKDLFHGVEVQLDGYKITLTISDLLETGFTNFTLRLYYSSQYVEHKVNLDISSECSETPSNFSINSSGETSITVQWIPGYSGGHTQTFCVEYRITGSRIWILKEIKTDYQLDKYNLYTLSGLQDKSSYELRMYAQNMLNQSQKTDIATSTTLQSGTTDEIQPVSFVGISE